MTATEINKYMAHFVQEARRQDGGEYPAGSLTNIVSSIQRFLRENGHPDVSFYDEKSVEYDQMRKSLGARMKGLTRRGIGLMKKASPTDHTWDGVCFVGEAPENACRTQVFW